MAGAPHDSRPLSPHLQIWRWHPTMAASIFHRVTGVGLYLAFIVLIVWLILLASGEQAYAWADVLFHTWFGQLKLYGVFGILMFHAFNGVRHLIWDTGRHLDPKAASGSAWMAFLFAIAATLAFFAWRSMGAGL